MASAEVGDAAVGVKFVITGAGGVGGAVNGSYTRCGEHEGKPMYRKIGGDSVLFFRGFWKLNDTGRTCVWRYSMPDERGEEPPIGPWTSYGYSLLDAQPPPSLAAPSKEARGIADKGEHPEKVARPPIAKAENEVGVRFKIGEGLKAEILEAFGALDDKDDGTVATEDVKELLTKLDPSAFTDEGLESVFASVGVSNGRLKYADFVAYVFGRGPGPGDPKDIPEEWGWPKEPFEPEDLNQYVLETTKATQAELWDEQLEARAIDSKKEDHMAERVFANVLLNKEGSGDDPIAGRDIDPHSYERGRWYRFLNHKGNCYVYCHNYSKDITAIRPGNFTDLTDEEKKRLAKLGTYVKELPDMIARIYDNERKIPVVFASEDTSDALRKFFIYDGKGELLDVSKVKRTNPKFLEDARMAIVNSCKLGKTLCIFMGNSQLELREKVCIPKNRDTFPVGTFRHGGLESDMTREKIYRDEDKEANQCVMRKNFRVCIVVTYDTMMFEMSSSGMANLPGIIPDFEYMHAIKCYNDDDKKKILAQMRGDEKPP